MSIRGDSQDAIAERAATAGAAVRQDDERPACDGAVGREGRWSRDHVHFAYEAGPTEGQRGYGGLAFWLAGGDVARPEPPGTGPYAG